MGEEIILQQDLAMPSSSVVRQTMGGVGAGISGEGERRLCLLRSFQAAGYRA